MYAYSLAHGTRYWYAAMERSLARALGQMSFTFTQIGPLTDYYGPVALYLGDLRQLEAQVGQHNPALMAWMRQGGAGMR
jgi:N-acyl amino acid synthase of PEP-CTERM/exosortase system